MHICRKEHAVVVQGITGKQGTFWTERMQDYGTNVIGGVNPKKAGTQHCRVPVYASVVDAAKEILIDTPFEDAVDGDVRLESACTPHSSEQ